MVLLSPPEFQYFLAHYASKYPYREISKTRRRFHVKWIITNKPTFGGNIPRNIGCYNAIPSKALDDDLVQYLIVHKKAQPATPLMCSILDWMHCWGRGIDVNWHSQIVDWLHFLLYHGIHLSDKLVLRDCVEYRMRKMISQRGLNVNTILPLWYQFLMSNSTREEIFSFTILPLRPSNGSRISF
jgi:hypothetical protein